MGGNAFLLTAELCSTEWMYYSLFVHCLVDEHLDYFQFGAAMNICVHVFLGGSRIAESRYVIIISGGHVLSSNP